MNRPTKMTCNSPNVAEILSSARCGGVTESSRRKRSDEDLSSEEENLELFDFSIGFDLDGVEDFNKTADVPWLETGFSFVMGYDPVITPFPDNGIMVLESTDTLLQIQGEDLDTSMRFFFLFLIHVLC